MAADLTMNTTNSVPKGAVVYEKGDPLESVALVLKGRVTVQADGVRMNLGAGNFLGMCDTNSKVHSFTYTALDDLVVYGLPVSDFNQACLLLDEKEQYRGLLITSYNFIIAQIDKMFHKLKTEAETAYEFLKKIYDEYHKEVNSSGLMPEQLTSMERLEQQKPGEIPMHERMEYCIQCSQIPVEAQRAFYSGNSYVAKEQFSAQCEVIPLVLEACRAYGEWLVRIFRIMIMDEKNLFTLTGKMALALKKAGQNERKLVGILDELMKKIDEIETLLSDMVGNAPNLDRERMERVYLALLSKDSEEITVGEKEEISSLNGSLSQILDYTALDDELAGNFAAAVEQFLRLQDKFARAPEAAAVRKKVTAGFFEIYEAVVKRSFQDENPPLAVRLFLRYGFVSEELLTADQLQALINLPDIDNESLECKVYTMPMWLKEIYEGRKNPSKDEFDTDYEEMLRKEAATGKRDPKTVKDVFMDPDLRLHYEVDKLLRYADRNVNGNISTFVPVLCSEGLYNKIENAVVTGAAINSEVHKIEKLDYSIFYREKLTTYTKIEVPNFTNITRFTPDFILFPVYGRNGVLWQDIEGRVKQSHARILLPALFEQELSAEILKLMAHFRWEKCRTDMGAQWNNYRYPSLTSEYTDYLQFYKKNNELTPEKKEKIKQQLQQCNNKHREVFAKDYQDWLIREAAGAMRMNRINRGIMFTYCPFADEVAQGLLVQNAYQEAARRHMTEKKKQEQSITVLERKFEKKGIEVPEEVKKTKEYLLGVS
jgi:cAMP-binding proteins - catabolite gene activator and regulatory subunit of cAMP-dependent protein kinases